MGIPKNFFKIKREYIQLKKWEGREKGGKVVLGKIKIKKSKKGFPAQRYSPISSSNGAPPFPPFPPIKVD